MFKNYCWSYDAWGNRTDEEGSNSAYPSNAGGASACSSQPQTEYNANNQIVGSGAPSYDAAGDVTSDPSGVAGIPGKQPTDLRYLYDAEGRICAVGAEGGSVMTGYVYDADGNRVAKGPITSWSCDPTTNGFESSGNETNYVLNQSGQIVTETTIDRNGNAQWVYTNVYANGSLFATYNAQGLHFLLNDWLGTRRASVNASGTVESICASLPYGDDLICSGALDTPNEQHFTGKTHDQESGNDYFGARYYAENMGRFLSPDWSVKVEPVPYSKLDNPQTLNLYAYVGNNPLSKADPDGHCPWCLAIAGGGAVAADTEGGTAIGSFFGPVGTVVGAAIGVGVGLYVVHEMSSSNTQAAPAVGPTGAMQSSSTPTPAASTGATGTSPRSNPMTGTPGSTSQTTQPDGSPKQVRRYGADGHPETDVDHGHDHGQGDPHAHDWGRPSDGSAPTHADRGPGRTPTPNDPQPQ